MTKDVDKLLNLAIPHIH